VVCRYIFKESKNGCGGIENFSDEEAERAIDTIERLARILLSIHMKNYQENGKFENSSKLREGSKENQEW
jgi:hypothetical protein